MTPLGTGFRLTPEQAAGFREQSPDCAAVLRPYAIGRDIVQTAESKFIIDLFGFDEAEVRHRFPALYQHLLIGVKPERDEKQRDSYRIKWWVFAEPRANLRPALAGLPRYIATCRTAKHRIFTFLPGEVLPDAKIIAIALDDGFHLGVLSSHVHCTWAIRAGSWLGVGNDSNYNHSDCFAKFPFPDATQIQQNRIRELAESIDAQRKSQQAQHPKLTLTDLYNVLAKLRAGTPFNAKEQLTHEQGLVSVLRQLHDELDAAVADAYGWPADLPEDELLARLVALNAARAAEEKTGRVRWLRPAFQRPVVAAGTETATQGEIGLEAGATGVTPAAGRRPWPTTLPEQARAVRTALQGMGEPTTTAAVSRLFTGARPAPMGELLETLVLLGQARQLPDGRFVGQL